MVADLVIALGLAAAMTGIYRMGGLDTVLILGGAFLIVVGLGMGARR